MAALCALAVAQGPCRDRAFTFHLRGGRSSLRGTACTTPDRGPDLCLYGDFRRLQFVRVARPIQFLVVGADDSGNLANLLGPRNLEQKIETMDCVRVNLPALVRAEAPSRNRQVAHFVRR